MMFKQVWMGTAVLLIASITHVGSAQTSVSRQAWGATPSGQSVELFKLADKSLKVSITTYGARVVRIDAPDRAGRMADVVLGYNNLAAYEKDNATYFGAIVGRYGNRIARGSFSIDGKAYHIPVNNNGNALHGGPQGFSSKVWSAAEIPGGVELTLVSPDGDMGFPGALTVHVRYTLEGASLKIDYSATTTRPTVLNLTNHSYFNLSGEGNGTVLNEVLTIPADRYTPVDATQIPTGQLAPVQGTPFDFLKPTPIGARIHDQNAQLKIGGGYDHNFVLNGQGSGLHLAAKVYDPEGGRTLTVTTTEPGVQFYSGNSLGGPSALPGGVTYQRYGGFALETQHFPDSPNHPQFPSTRLNPGQTMHSETVFTFGAK